MNVQDYFIHRKKTLVKHLFIPIGISVIFLLIIMKIFFFSSVPSTSSSQSLILPEQTTTSSTLDSEKKQEDEAWYIDIKGQVKHPGVYQVHKGQRVVDAIHQAGGFLEEADQTQINLAQLLVDQQCIIVPKKGEELHNLSSQGSSSKQVNINTADITLLMTLKGIGNKKANEIILYREKKGLFKSIEEIKEVSGIGEKLFEGIKDEICVH